MAAVDMLLEIDPSGSPKWLRDHKALPHKKRVVNVSPLTKSLFYRLWHPIGETSSPSLSRSIWPTRLMRLNGLSGLRHTLCIYGLSSALQHSINS